MAVDQAVLDPRGPSRLRTESTALSLVIVCLGGFALGTVLVGTVILIVVRDFSPVSNLVETLKSSELRSLLIAGIAAGGLAAAVGWGSYRRMPTKLAREQSIAGAIFGSQAAVFGAGLLLFVSLGNVSKFATNFLDIEAVRPHLAAFRHGARNTIVLAFAGEVLGIVLGLVLAVLAISKRAVVRAPARVYINFFRGTPLIWQLSFIYFGLAIGLGLNFSTFTAAIIAFGLNTGAYAAEVFRAGIQSIERGQLDAARGLGMSYLQGLRYAVLPQAVRRVIPPLMNEFVILIKDTALVIVLGLLPRERELFAVGREFFSDTFNPSFFVATALGYLVVCLPLIGLVTALERRLRSGLVGAVGHAS
jgi:His/Glu/Gln/Arg/opine family amino acid ABC transporter permease subunit